MITYYNRKPTGRSNKDELTIVDPEKAIPGDINWGVIGNKPEDLASAKDYIFTDIFDPPCFILLDGYRKYTPTERKKMRAAIKKARAFAPQPANVDEGGYRLLRTPSRTPHRYISPGSNSEPGCWPGAGLISSDDRY